MWFEPKNQWPVATRNCLKLSCALALNSLNALWLASRCCPSDEAGLSSAKPAVWRLLFHSCLCHVAIGDLLGIQFVHFANCAGQRSTTQQYFLGSAMPLILQVALSPSHMKIETLNPLVVTPRSPVAASQVMALCRIQLLASLTS